MQYTIRNIPSELDKQLRHRAKQEARSLNEVLIEALTLGLGLGDRPPKVRDLSDLSGTWDVDPEIELALSEQRQIEEHLWR